MNLRNHSKRLAIIGSRGYPSYYGGFETAVRKLAPFFADAEWDVTVYGRAGEVLEDDPKRDRRVRSINTWGLSSKSLSTLTHGFTATLHAICSRPNVVLLMNVANGYWLPLLKLFRIPTILNVDGIEWERDKWGPIGKITFRLGAKLTALFADEIVCDSQAIAEYWNAKFGVRGSYIPYGGEVAETLPVPQGLYHRDFVLLVARFVPENSVPEFFQAAQELARNHDVVLVGATGFGGELDLRANLLAIEHDRIFWFGHVSDDQQLFALFQHCGVYFHGHSVGGTNPALVQAMALGAPVVARSTVYNIEVLGREYPHICQPNPVDIAASVTQLLQARDEQDRVSQELQSRALDMYSWTSICRAYLDLASRLCGRSRD